MLSAMCVCQGKPGRPQTKECKRLSVNKSIIKGLASIIGVCVLGAVLVRRLAAAIIICNGSKSNDANVGLQSPDDDVRSVPAA